jgi:signal transduction histidine kinase
MGAFTNADRPADSPPNLTELFAALQNTPAFSKLGAEERRYLESGKVISLRAGEVLVKVGDPPEEFFIFLEGEVRVTKRAGAIDHTLVAYKAGNFFGELPLLLSIPYLVSVTAAVATRVFVLPKDDFWQLLRACPGVATEVLRAMVTRLRNLEGFTQQQEKLVSLGTMAAGLAHELNNPSAAAQRAATHLEEALERIEEATSRLHQEMGAANWEALAPFADKLIAALPNSAPLSSLDQADLEDEITSWLDEREIPDAWKYAGPLSAARVSKTELDELASVLPSAALADALPWLEARITIASLLNQIDQSIGRVSELINAVQSYSKEDNTPPKETDLHQGIETALTVLGHKLKGVAVTRAFDSELPPLRARPNELIQVWTNLIDNAADVLKGDGAITILTCRDGHQALVEIIDNGPGISPENLTRIFEPFFTTKGVGAGTGLGLVISQRIIEQHGGEIEVESKPGDTRFIVRLPLESAKPPAGSTKAVEAAPGETVVAVPPPPLLPAAVRDGDASPSPNASRYASVTDVPFLQSLDEAGRSCLIGGKEISLHASETLITEDSVAEHFFILLEGELRISKHYEAQEVVLGTAKPGMFFGEIQLMMGTPYGATATAVMPSRIFQLPRVGFWNLLRLSAAASAEILQTLATRVRNLESYTQQRERLASLGGFAAGLAEELNNPASAAQRAAAQLHETVNNSQNFSCQLSRELSDPQWQQVVALAQKAPAARAPISPPTPMEASDREEAVGACLVHHHIDGGWEIAPALASAGIDEPTLDKLAAELPAESLKPVLQWVEARLSTSALLQSVEQSTRRISELVKTVKAYSFMDQAPLQEIDVHDGIEDTLAVLAHRLESIDLVRDYDRSLPRIMAYGSELNQVWTNLLANAIDALHDHSDRRISIRTRNEENRVVVEITDNGAGIPEDVRPRVFQAFFTTKRDGKGLGLGLVISHRIVTDRHGGAIEFDSKPGETLFRVKLPITR